MGDVSVITGQQEGSHEWSAVNYLLGSLDASAGVRSSAVLGMGGASTQISLVPPPEEPLKAGQYSISLRGLPERELYIHSYLGLGLTSAQVCACVYHHKKECCSCTILRAVMKTVLLE